MSSSNLLVNIKGVKAIFKNRKELSDYITANPDCKDSYYIIM